MSRSVMIAITALLLIALAGWGLSAVSASRWRELPADWKTN
ncbi:hypothetical protein PCI56_23825 [Plesiomonas shigelloides subsp. oncorhynchi]|nr:hypothetical protein [Plesiomonas shigelloides]